MVPMELYETGPLRGMQSLIALIKISPAILTKGCAGRRTKSLTILILPLIQIIQLYDMVVACHPASHNWIKKEGKERSGDWLSLKKFQIWDGHYSDKINYSLTFNISTNWTFYIQAVWEILMCSWKEQFLPMKVYKNFLARIANYILA